MDDIMILMNGINIDIQGFNETQFEIFDNSDTHQLLHIWNEVNQDINKFISKLSPEQKYRMTLWACGRTTYKVSELINALEKFTKYLKNSNNEFYPLHKVDKKKKSIFKKKNLQ